jgi:hypothetical protein
MKNIFTIISLNTFFLLVSVNTYSQTSYTWTVDNLNSIGGYATTVYGNPTVVDFGSYKAVQFDGIDDGLLVPNNPLVGATSFTVEIIFSPYSGGAFEQRFLHIQQDDNNRLLIELRSTTADNWYLDTFIKSGGVSSPTLANTAMVHSNILWHHAALVYSNGTMSDYVDGVYEKSGAINYVKETTGATSLGVRQNKVAWFKGAIRLVKVTHAVLTPAEFTTFDVLDNIGYHTTTALSNGSFAIENAYIKPSSSLINLSLQIFEKGSLTVDLVSVTGHTTNLLTNMSVTKGLQNIPIDTACQIPGIYFLKVTLNQIQQVVKIII